MNKNLRRALEVFILKLVAEASSIVVYFLTIYNGRANLPLIQKCSGVLYSIGIILFPFAMYLLYKNYSIKELDRIGEASPLRGNNTWAGKWECIQYSFGKGRPLFVFYLLWAHFAFTVFCTNIVLWPVAGSWEDYYLSMHFLMAITFLPGSFLMLLLVTILAKNFPVTIKQEQDTVK